MTSPNTKGIDIETKAHYAIRRDGDVVTCHCGYVGIADDKYRKHWDSPNTKNALEAKKDEAIQKIFDTLDERVKRSNYSGFMIQFASACIDFYSQEFLQDLKARIEKLQPKRSLMWEFDEGFVDCRDKVLALPEFSLLESSEKAKE